MKVRLACVFVLLAACASPPPPRPKVIPPQPQPQQQQSANALTSVANVAKTIAEPRIRVGLLSDQVSVTFPRIDGGYYIITDSGASTLRRGFTDSAPLPEVATHFAVQAGAFADAASATSLVQQL